MPEKEELRQRVIGGLVNIAQRMEEVNGLFDKAGNNLAQAELGGLILTEMHFLALLAGDEPVNGVAAARKLGMTRGGVSKMAARLQVGGFVQPRRISGDKKSLLYELTDKGLRAAAMHRTLHNLAEDLLWERLKASPEEELERFARMLARTAEALGEANRQVRINATALLAGEKK
ncbi:MarR family transcriptional regulator [Desulfovibrio sp.]|uniref:MarR family winged helix-turn-helix transcriptional regulator n=1 Tax=Desulfovibrio sp. TaxID=885 RepID=UPI0025BCB820|nr:MarR family transcriptional regulator [Desulfovibrio sp.]